MSEIEKRREKGIDYWIERCDKGEAIQEEYESNTQRLLSSLAKTSSGFKVSDKKTMRLGISKLMLLEYMDASHLGVKPFKR